MGIPHRNHPAAVVARGPYDHHGTSGQGAGYEVAEAASAAEAQERVRASRAPDVLVTDKLMMPGARDRPSDRPCKKLPHLKVRVATGYADMPDILIGGSPSRLRRRSWWRGKGVGGGGG
jgi:CheY-like chemotaxis protein